MRSVSNNLCSILVDNASLCLCFVRVFTGKTVKLFLMSAEERYDFDCKEELVTSRALISKMSLVDEADRFIRRFKVSFNSPLICFVPLSALYLISGKGTFFKVTTSYT